MSTTGLTGGQVLKFIRAPRVYVKAPDVVPSAPLSISNGTTPAGWSDLGIIEGNVKIGVEKKVSHVLTGVDGKLRGSYASEHMGTIEFTLDQFDDVAVGLITGIQASVITSGNTVAYNVGAEDLNSLAILVVLQNKLDGKEIQFYNPNASINFSFDDNGDMLTLKVTGWLPFFTQSGFSEESMLVMTIIAPVEANPTATLFDSHPGLFDSGVGPFDSQ